MKRTFDDLSLNNDIISTIDKNIIQKCDSDCNDNNCNNEKKSDFDIKSDDDGKYNVIETNKEKHINLKSMFTKLGYSDDYTNYNCFGGLYNECLIRGNKPFNPIKEYTMDVNNKNQTRYDFCRYIYNEKYGEDIDDYTRVTYNIFTKLTERWIIRIIDHKLMISVEDGDFILYADFLKIRKKLYSTKKGNSGKYALNCICSHWIKHPCFIMIRGQDKNTQKKELLVLGNCCIEDFREMHELSINNDNSKKLTYCIDYCKPRKSGCDYTHPICDDCYSYGIKYDEFVKIYNASIEDSYIKELVKTFDKNVYTEIDNEILLTFNCKMFFNSYSNSKYKYELIIDDINIVIFLKNYIKKYSITSNVIFTFTKKKNYITINREILGNLDSLINIKILNKKKLLFSSNNDIVEQEKKKIIYEEMKKEEEIIRIEKEKALQILIKKQEIEKIEREEKYKKIREEQEKDDNQINKSYEYIQYQFKRQNKIIIEADLEEIYVFEKKKYYYTFNDKKKLKIVEKFIKYNFKNYKEQNNLVNIEETKYVVDNMIKINNKLDNYNGNVYELNITPKCEIFNDYVYFKKIEITIPFFIIKCDAQLIVSIGSNKKLILKNDDMLIIKKKLLDYWDGKYLIYSKLLYENELSINYTCNFNNSNNNIINYTIYFQTPFLIEESAGSGFNLIYTFAFIYN